MLDTRTVGLMLVMTIAVTALVHMANWRLHRQMRGPGWWTAGSSMMLVGALLILLRGKIPDALSIVLANVLICGSQGLMLRGSCAFARQPMPWWPAGLAVAVVAVGFTVFTYVQPSLTARWAVLGGSCALLMAINVWVLSRLLPQEGLGGVALYGAATAASAVLMLGVPVAVAVSGEGRGQPLDPGPVTSIGLMTWAALVMLQTFGRLLMTANHTQRELARLAMVDPLTGVANRRAFDEALDRALASARRSRASVGLVLVDVDHFKSINDTHGHAIGDEVLREVGHRLAGFLRTTDMPARVGGEEFAVILHEPLPGALREVSERVRKAVGGRPVRVGDRILPVTVSLGAAIWPSPGVTDKDSLYKVADQALYAAKQAGRDCVVVAGQPLN